MCAAGVAVSVVASVALVAVPPSAQALIGAVIPMNGAQDPIEEIRADDALFAYVTADIVGGRVCVVNPVGDPDGFSCDSPAWGDAEDVSADGSIIIPLERPLLTIGPWRLMGESPGGKVVSERFTVLPCGDGCDTTYGNVAVDLWKEAAKGPAEFVEYTSKLCAGLMIVSGGRTLKSGGQVVDKQSEFLKEVIRNGPIRSWSYQVQKAAIGTATSTGTFAFDVISGIPTSVPGLLIAIVRVGTCRAAAMFDRMVADPPDENYQQVAAPDVSAQPVTNSVEVNRVLAAMALVEATGQAQLTAYERYLGATLAGSTTYQHVQSAAAARYGFELVQRMRDAADALRAYAEVLDADLELSTEAPTQSEIDGMVARFTRIHDQGFTSEELAVLTAEGLTDDQIAGVRTQFDPDLIRPAPADTTVPSVLRQAAAQYDESALGLELFARESEGVASATDAPPVAAFDAAVDGLTLNLASTATNTDGDEPTERTWDFGDGEAATGASASHSYAAAGTYRVTHTVCDLYACDTTGRDERVGVVGEPPNAAFTVDQPRNEGRLLTFDAAASGDAEGRIVRYDWDFGDGQTFPGGGREVVHTYADDGTFPVELTVTDEAGNTDTAEQDLVIDNLPPTITPRLPTRVPSGTTRQYEATVTDPGVADARNITWDFGDGTAPVLSVPASGQVSRVQHRFASDGPYTVTITADDGDGGVTTTQVPLLVAPPTADAGGDKAVDEGTPVTLGVAGTSPADAGGTQFAWQFGDGTSASGRTPSHVYTDEGTYTATLRVSDYDVPGVVVTDGATVAVRNVAPSLSVLAPAAAVPGEVVSMRAFPTDPGDDDLSVVWDFGDGDTATGLSVDHPFAAGTHTVAVSVSDGDGGAAVVEKRVVVVEGPPGDGRRDSRGTDFWLAFMPGLGSSDPQLFVSGASGTQGVVEVPGIGFRYAFTVGSGGVVAVHVPDQLVTGGAFDRPLPYGIHVSADDSVSVYGLNYGEFTTDGFLGLPREVLGTQYYSVGYAGFSGGELAVLATKHDTTVHLIGRNGQEITETLDAGDVYVLHRGHDDAIGRQPNGELDFTGVQITADKPVAAYGGAFCGNVPTDKAACNHLVEQLTPTSQWGRQFFTAPFATRHNGDRIRVVASGAQTEVRVNGELIATLDAGDFVEHVVEGGAQIETSKPALLASFAHSWAWDFVTGDPTMALVVPFEQYLSSYLVATPSDPFQSHYVNVVTPIAQIGELELDGEPVPANAFTEIGPSGWAWAQLPLEAGSHRLTAPRPFGLMQYGWGTFDAYGWSGGSQLAEVATLTGVSLDPAAATSPIGAETCLEVSVEDGDGGPVSDVRVDWTAAGANADQGFVITGADGTASICLTGTEQGEDRVTARVAGFSATSTITWIGTNEPPTATGQSLKTLEGVPIGVTLGGSDPDGDNLTFVVADPPARGTLDGVPPDLTYTPDAGFSGADGFTFTVRDGKATSAAAAVSLTVVPVNKAPIAQAQSRSTPEDTPLDITLTGSDPDGDHLTLTVTHQPEHGTLTGTAPDLRYRPAADYSGTDGFTFRVCDDGTTDGAPDFKCDTATVSISVIPVDDAPAPSTAAPATQQVQYSDAVAAVVVSATDPDTTPAQLTATVSWKRAGDQTYATTTPLGGLTLTPLSALDSTPRTWRLAGHALVGVGTYTVRVTVTDGSTAATTDATIVVTAEDAKLSYTGDALTSTGSSGTADVRVGALVAEAADGAIGGKLGTTDVRFDAYRSADTTMTSPARSCTAAITNTVSGTGEAACTLTGLAADTYTLALRMPPNPFYVAPREVSVVAVIVPGAGKTNGGGRLTEPQFGTTSNFGFTAKVLKNGKPQGSSVYIYRRTVQVGSVPNPAGGFLPAGEYNWIVKSNAISSLVSSCPTTTTCTAAFTGKANVTAVHRASNVAYSLGGNYTFQIDVTDGGEPAKTGAPPDAYAIKVSNARGTYYQLGSPTQKVQIAAGNIQVKR